MEKYCIRPAEPDDCEAVMTNIKELATMLKCEHQVVNTVESLRRNGFGENKIFYCYVAELEKEIIGHVVYLYTYSTWVGNTVYMEDFYVKPEHRGKGVGTRLWKTVVKEALEKECIRMDWGVLSWNKPAIEFYKRRGAINLTESEMFHVYRLRQQEMKIFTKE